MQPSWPPPFLQSPENTAGEDAYFPERILACFLAGNTSLEVTARSCSPLNNSRQL